jgi:sortase A
VRRIFGFLITVLGALMVVFAAITLLRPVWLQEIYTQTHELLETGPLPALADVRGASSPDSASAPESRTPPQEGRPIGVLEIPRLGVSSVVIEGDEAAALILGVGHLADTPLPWSSGNSVFAAHRDTFFRPLEHIRPKDIIRFTSHDAELEYVVQSTRIVAPNDVEVLSPTPSNVLTLITCYPFTYVGPAPKRFIVRAERVS